MTTRMLIDARHREETRVAVVKNNRIEEFDFESAERKQLKGNIYLAKVTRVEPSLQAAFVDYGGNRHGFLAFSEIHPDYYQIPKEDRDALLAEEAEHAAEEAALRAEQDVDGDGDDEVDDLDHDEGFEEDDHEGDDLDVPTDEAAEGSEQPQGETQGGRKRRGKRGATDDQVEALRDRRMNLRRRYKIQDVIRRRQVLLVQIVKEERGNKGAALTSYLSLAGRYCVLMPNTSHGGGISRKISSSADRKRLKSIMADMQLPPSMGCIVRTAGLQRTKIEIKRDFDYLARLWDEIRDKTLSSSAPAVVYGDSDLLKRAIRDIYNKDIDEVIVEGGDGYRQAKDFMRLLMPSHARKVKQYADVVPLFQRSHVEEQLAGMYNPVVQLKSGGYLVINPTEALVSIDVNSGRSTREHNIEQTATATNLEASAEIARQLRLRDMAGLVVIDFIDMDNSSNNRKVEKAMKDALKDDRARIQIGRISSFGLMEMSRQRLRTGVLEASTRGCPHCEGTGLVRTASSAGLSALRMIEEEAARGRGSCLTLRASQEATIYVLNRKRADIAEIEDRYGVQVEILPDREEEGARMSVEASGPPPAHPPRIEALVVEEEEDDYLDEPEVDEAELDGNMEETAEAVVAPRAPRAERREDDGEGGRKRRRRRGRGRGRRDEEGEQAAVGEGEAVDEALLEAAGAEVEQLEAGVSQESAEGGAFAGEQPVEGDEPQADGEGRRRRGRRGRRGGRRGDRPAEVAGEEPVGEALAGAIGDEPDMLVEAGVEPEPQAEPQPEPDIVEAGDAGVVTTALAIVAPTEDAPRTRRRPRARKSDATENVGDAPSLEESAPAMEDTPVEEAAAPKRSRRKGSPAADAPVAELTSGSGPASDVGPQAVPDSASDTPKPRRSRRKKADAADVEASKPQPVAPETLEPQAIEAEPELTLAVGQDGTLPDAPTEDAATDQAQADMVAAAADDASAEPRRGWWQRTFGA